MNRVIQFVAFFFLLGGFILAITCVIRTLFEGQDDGSGLLAITGALFSAAGLLALRDRMP